MDRTRIVEHAGQRILIFDFSGLKEEAESMAAIDAAVGFVTGDEEPHSLLTLTLTTDAEYNAAVAAKLWALVRHNKPYVKAAAIVGVESRFQKHLLEFISTMSQREFRVFETEEEAKDWLVSVA